MKILIVEDDPIIQRMYARTMENAGLAINLAADGASVQNIALAEHPDIVLMDLMLPLMNGIDALKTLKANEQTKTIPVIMLSAYDDPDLMQEALDAGASRYLTKDTLEPSQILILVQQTIAPNNSSAASVLPAT